MREILFRGKRKDNGYWIYGNFNFYPDINRTFIRKNNKELLPSFQTSLEDEVISKTVGQYTGLADKNGTKIFEGDVIKSDNGRISAISVVLYGKFEPKHFYDLIERYVRPRPTEKLYGLFAKSTEGEEMLLSECSHLIEVIGNIHDNPELLEGVNNGST